MKRGDMMSIKREKIVKEAKEIKDIEEWLSETLLEHIQEKKDRAFPVKELILVGKKPGLGLFNALLTLRIILRLVNEDKIKAFDYKGMLLIAAK
jgi:hypothetical protein